MQTIARLAPAYAAGLVLAVTAACVTAQPYEKAYIDMSTCRDVSAQVEIDGEMQPVTGRACLQSDGSWVLVGAYGADAGDPYAYRYWPWYYWGGPVVVTGSFVFVDRFHRFHHFHHGGGFRPGMRMRPSGMGRGWHGGGSWGGGMRRH